MKFNSYLTYLAVLATLGLAQTIPANTPVRFRLAEDTEVCLGAVTNARQAEILVTACDSPNTIFQLTMGGPNETTDIVLAESLSGGPILCITARNSLAGNTPVILDLCEDDIWEHWRVSSGTGTGPGEILSAVPTNGDYCLAAQHAGLGDPILFAGSSDAFSQQWVVDIIGD
ncbi:unnamed protein product [Peniophora sp. CBMAI 1063]|nr:unnamed protein product [Peniophora sp. CBMAI 1063]